MTRLDWLIVIFAALLAIFGFRRGFIVAVLSFGGFAIGAFLGTRLGPLLLARGSSSPYAPAFGLIGALLAGAILATGFEGVGLRLRRVLVVPGLGLVDGTLGALLSAALGLAIAWIFAAVVLQTAPTARLRADIQRSEILSELNQLLPPSGPILNVLASLDPQKAFGPSAFGALRVRAVNADGVAGDWQPLVTLVRVPVLQRLQCGTSATDGCTLSGTNLFLIDSIAADADFIDKVSVPEGFVDQLLKVPHPAAGSTLYFRLRDDPAVVDKAVIPVAAARADAKHYAGGAATVQ